MSRRSSKHSKFQFLAIILIAAIVTIWLGLLGNFVWKQMAPVNQLPEQPTETPSSQPDPSAPIAVEPLPNNPPPPSTPTPTPPNPTFVPPDNPPIQTPVLPPTPNVEIRQKPQKLNHFYYEEARGSLVPVGEYYDRTEEMVPEAAAAFEDMKYAAGQSGIKLGPISGFRSVADQAQLFNRQVSRQGSEAKAAELSAPPNYSEHHTGYTIDIRDLDEPDTDLKYAMENTQAYQWLRRNACDYGFELSFPEGNQQGVSFEPWHWRYIRSQEAKRIFAQARSQFPKSTCPAA